MQAGHDLHLAFHHSKSPQLSRLLLSALCDRLSEGKARPPTWSPKIASQRRGDNAGGTARGRRYFEREPESLGWGHAMGDFFQLSSKAADYKARVERFMGEHIYPNEARLFETAETQKDRWEPLALLEELKIKMHGRSLSRAHTRTCAQV